MPRMNNYILISKTFTEVTPESAENGDFSKTGFIEKRVKVTFRELVELMKDHPHGSQSPNDGNKHVWYTCSSFTSDYKKGVERDESIHFHRQNTPNAEKYWRLARKFADK
jgi:hypothetical protein